MSELKEYHSGFTGPEVDSLLTKVKDGSLTADIEKELAEKADAKGRYPEMSVGFSDDLVGRGESVPAEFSFRASGGKSIKDGSARIKCIKGNSVVWNQWVDTIAPQDCDLSETDNRLTITPQGAFPGVFNATTMNLIVNHVYICISHRIEGGFLKVNCGGYDGGTNVPFRTTYGYYGFTVYSYGETQPFTITRPILIDLTLMFGAGNEPTTIEEYEARKPIVEDEYAYNEGEVIPFAAEGIKSVGDNAWDEEWELGFIDPTNGNENDSPYTIRSKNYNKIIGGEQYVVMQDTGGDTAPDSACDLILYDEDKNFIDFWGIPEVYRKLSIGSRARYFKVAFKVAYGTTYKNDVMISLMHSGWKADTDAKYQPYWEDRLMLDARIREAFPNGMSKWDMVYNKNGKGYIVKGLGIIDDLSLYDWQYLDDDGRFYVDGISGLTSVDVTEMSELLCAKYVTLSALDTYLGKDGIANDNDRLWIKDNSTTEVATIKDKLHNVRLYHRLAEPVVIEYDEPFNLDYRVADFGTEEIIAPQPSAPISADIIYQFNAVDMIREHELEITELQRIIATMQAQLTSLTSNNGGQ